MFIRDMIIGPDQQLYISGEFETGPEILQES